MFNREKLNDLNAYFKSCPNRGGTAFYFCRLDSYNHQAEEFLTHYMSEVKKQGIYLKGKLPNPDERQLAFLEEIIGSSFLPDGNFILQTLKKWLPRLNSAQLEALTESMYQILTEMIRAGKTENMLKNAYFKFMCWFYYKFERILTQLGKDSLPKILYEGDVSDSELKILRILAASGCDVLLVERNGDQEYQKIDPKSLHSQMISLSGAGRFPESMSLSKLGMTAGGNLSAGRSASQETVGPAGSSQSGRIPTARRPDIGQVVPPLGIKPQDKRREPVSSAPVRPVVPEPESRENTAQSFRIQTSGTMGTNIWITGDILKDALKAAADRGNDRSVYYNLFVLLKGTDDREEYQKELLRWKLKMDSGHRKLLIAERQIGMPATDEISRIRRANYTSLHQLLSDMMIHISYPKCRELENLVKKAFVELLCEEQKPLQVLTNQAVLLICWLDRFIPQLFKEWKLNSCPIFLYFGMVKNENEARFIRLLARIPVDVIILCPELETPSLFQDQLLFEKKGTESAAMDRFPQNVGEVSFGTVAYQAEQDLNTVMYQDTGLYRNRQFKRAIPVPIRTTYEEIGILWNQEAKYRPDFEVLDDRVMVPAIFSKVSGVKDGDRSGYWQWVKGLMTEDTFIIKALPFLNGQSPNPMKQHAAAFLKNGKLQAAKIRQHPSYQYGFIREDMQDYMFDKLDQLLESKVINGTYTQGVEYTICSVALNLDKNILRMIQKYDFTKTIPKLILINTAESMCSLEDSILTAYLSMLGFDVLILVPTGYQSMERFYSRPLFIEHQIGDYVYDMSVPDLKPLSGSSYRENIIEKLFKRGR